jgi:hypothetical protein
VKLRPVRVSAPALNLGVLPGELAALLEPLSIRFTANNRVMSEAASMLASRVARTGKRARASPVSAAVVERNRGQVGDRPRYSSKLTVSENAVKIPEIIFVSGSESPIAEAEMGAVESQAVIGWNDPRHP